MSAFLKTEDIEVDILRTANKNYVCKLGKEWRRLWTYSCVGGDNTAIGVDGHFEIETEHKSRVTQLNNNLFTVDSISGLLSHIHHAGLFSLCVYHNNLVGSD